MSDHLSPAVLNSLADGELTPDQRATVDEHLAECLSCTSSALFQSLLKSATAKAGQRYEPPSQLLQRLALRAQEENAPSKSPPSRIILWPARRTAFAGWVAAFALLLVFGSVVFVQQSSYRTAIVSSRYAGLVTEACDQHVATLASNLEPQVISSDRHTVKPWFQGKLPFSFNLPENLPDDTKLEGANLTYFGNQPAALLLYSVGKHRVSVFVRQRTGAGIPTGFSAEHEGFHVIGFSTDELEAVAVSDVDPNRLSNLVGVIEQSQAQASRSFK
jgi:anti-sigma factor RsiW